MPKQKVVISINRDDVVNLAEMLVNGSHLTFNFNTEGGTAVEIVFIPERKQHDS